MKQNYRAVKTAHKALRTWKASLPKAGKESRNELTNTALREQRKRKARIKH